MIFFFYNIKKQPMLILEGRSKLLCTLVTRNMLQLLFPATSIHSIAAPAAAKTSMK